MAGCQSLYLLLAKENQRIVFARIARTTLVFLLSFSLSGLFYENVFAQARCGPAPGAAQCGGDTSDVGSAPAPVRSNHIGNPVDLLSGNKYQRGDDFAAFASPLVHTRHYNSALVNQNMGLGYGWRDTYSLRLYKIDGAGYRLIQSDGRSLAFNQLSDDGSTWRTEVASDGVLSGAEKPQWTLPDGRSWSFAGSYPISLHLPDGSALSLNYKNQRLHSVTDNLGASLHYHYTSGRRDLNRYSMDNTGSQPGHLACLQLPDGSGIRYGYDLHSNLVSVTHSDSVNWLYRYGNEAFPQHLTQASRSVMNVGAVWGCDEAVQIAANDANIAESEMGYQSAWEYHEDGRVSAWRHGDREVSIGFEDNHRTVVKDSTQMRTYRYDFSEGSDADVDVKDCEDCDWSRLVVFSDASNFSEKTVAHDSSVYAQRRQLRDELIRRDVEVVENRFGSVGYVESLNTLDLTRTFNRQSPAFNIQLPSGPPAPIAQCPLPVGMTCGELEDAIVYAELAECAYEDDACPNGWDIINPQNLGIDPSLLDFEGYHAVILYNPVTNEFVVTFEGTNFFSGSDWLSNAQNFLNSTNPLHYEQAAALALSLDQSLAIFYPNSTLSFTGHSLGGGLATIAALTVDEPAVVFNSAAVGSHVLLSNGFVPADAENLVDVINVSGDPVTYLQEQAAWVAPGTHYTIGDPTVSFSIPAHFLSSIQHDLAQTYRDNCVIP